MRELPRATYALMVSLLPATATVIGVVVLAQLPTAAELAGVALVILGVALHRDGEQLHTASGEGGSGTATGERAQQRRDLPAARATMQGVEQVSR